MTSTLTTITTITKWTTVATVGYSGPARGAHHTPKGENPAAHGGICYLQARRGAGGVVLGREVNSNGRHEETGEPWPLNTDDMDSWEAAAARARRLPRLVALLTSDL